MIERAENDDELMKENEILKQKIQNVKRMMGEALEAYRDPLESLAAQLEMSREEEKDLSNNLNIFKELFKNSHIKDVKKLSAFVLQ